MRVSDLEKQLEAVNKECIDKIEEAEKYKKESE